MTIVPSPNFTVVDVTGALRAALAFFAVLLFPGYLAGVATNLFRFRSRTFLEQGAWSVALSFCTVPVYVTLVGRLIPLGTVAATLGIAAVAALISLAAAWRRVRISWDRYTLLLASLLLLASALVIAELVDIQRGDALHLSVTVLDQSYRVAFTDALARTGIPPSNPLYHPGAAAPLRYYYFWYALCAVCMKLAHVTARQALIASSIWSGIGLLAVIALFARHFLLIRTRLHRFILTAALLLGVTGLDIVPTLFNILTKHVFDGDLEWWSKDQISSWLDTVLWVPNHLAATIACVTAFLLLWRTQERPARKHVVAAILLAGTAAAGALGLSVYVAAGFALLMLAYCVRLGAQRNWTLLRSIAGAVIFASLLSLPYLREMTHGRSAMEKGSSATAAHLFEFSVRGMIDAELITGLPALAAVHRGHPVLLDQAVRLVLLLPGYALELGFFAAVLVLVLRRRRDLDEPRSTALFLAFAGLILVGFVRSSIIENNDFGYRAALFPCFFLLLLGADTLRRRPAEPAPRQAIRSQVETIAMTALIVLGVAGTVFQAVALRFYLPLQSGRGVTGFAELPGDAFAARKAYAAAALPAGAIVQANPSQVSRYAYLVNLLYAQRGFATDNAPECGAVFGGDPAPCSRLRAELTALFGATGQAAAGSAQAQAACRESGIGYLAAASSDPAWSNPRGWVWTLPLVAGDEGPPAALPHGFRILNCKFGSDDLH